MDLYITMVVLMAICQLASAGRSLEDKIKTRSRKLGATKGLDILMGKFPKLPTDGTEFDRYIRLRGASLEELTTQVEKVMAEDFDDSLSEGADINRRMVALKFDSLFMKPCDSVLTLLGEDYAAILRKGEITNDILAWELFLKVDICTKLVPVHEKIIDQVCNTVFCSDLTLIKIKQLQQTDIEADQAIYEELKALNANFVVLNSRLTPSG